MVEVVSRKVPRIKFRSRNKQYFILETKRGKTLLIAFPLPTM
jgi:hypothetical protein